MKVTDVLCGPVLLPAFVGVFGLFFSRKQAATAEAPPPPPLTSAEEERIRLRTANRVRPLEPEEEGRAISAAPNGVYGFTYAPATETPVFAKPAYHAFEVHKLADGSDYVIGSVTDQEAMQLARATVAVEVKMYPEPAGASTRLVMVESSRLHRSNAKAAREDGNPVLFHVYPR